MELAGIQKLYENLGKEDPLWAVMTQDEFRHNRWDLEEFFATGRREIDEVRTYMESLERPIGGRALDFGCGVGRLTQALAGCAEEVVGVDISAPMVERAEEFNQVGDRCSYLVNHAPDLSLLESDSFDFVYSNKTLQHMPPRFSLQYVAEFLRVLKVGGVALFMIPLGSPCQEGSWRHRLYTLRTERLRPWLKKLRGRPQVEMHYVDPGRVCAVIEGHGGQLIERVNLTPERRSRHRMRYCAVKTA